MTKYIHYFYLVAFLLVASKNINAQDDKKISFTGAARSTFYADKLKQDTDVVDTITVPKLNSGHVMVDLGVSIRPNKSTEILGMVRVRNDYGGFWGAGVTFDVRQLYVKGVIGNIVRYQLGDFNYRMTRYTLWNYNQEVVSNTPAIFQQQTDQINYDHFYNNDNSWRQQGASAGFALEFSKFVQELQFNAVTTRVRTADFAQTNDRLFSGINAQLTQSKYLTLGFNYANMYDVGETSKSNLGFRNPVLTGTILSETTFKNWKGTLDAEFGKSQTFILNDTIAPNWRGKFFDVNASISQSKWGVQLTANPKYINSEFRSPGAQTKRIDYNGLPLAYSRITNNQELRNLTMLDLMRESSFYNMQLRPYLMGFSPSYDNITPYGDVTPNRQGITLKAMFNKKGLPITAEIAQSQLQEVRGEGTLIPRKFSRTAIKAELKVNEFFKGWRKQFHLSFNMRDDKTTRETEGIVKGVDLNTTAITAGMELEILQNLDILFGVQQLTYKGFDYTAVRNNYSEVFNFAEFNTDGSESMTAYGLRYRFSEKSILTAQVNKFNAKNALSTLPSYSINQFMLLFQMKF